MQMHRGADAFISNNERDIILKVCCRVVSRHMPDHCSGIHSFPVQDAVWHEGALAARRHSRHCIAAHSWVPVSCSLEQLVFSPSKPHTT